MDLHQRKLVVLTQEEAESSVLCEDTSVAHPKVDKVDVIALRVTPLKAIQNNSKHFKKMYFKILLLLIKVAIDDDLKPPVKSWMNVSDFISCRSPCFGLKRGQWLSKSIILYTWMSLTKLV